MVMVGQRHCHPPVCKAPPRLKFSSTTDANGVKKHQTDVSQFFVTFFCELWNCNTKIKDQSQYLALNQLQCNQDRLLRKFHANRFIILITNKLNQSRVLFGDTNDPINLCSDLVLGSRERTSFLLFIFYFNLPLDGALAFFLQQNHN